MRTGNYWLDRIEADDKADEWDKQEWLDASEFKFDDFKAYITGPVIAFMFFRDGMKTSISLSYKLWKTDKDAAWKLVCKMADERFKYSKEQGAE